MKKITIAALIVLGGFSANAQTKKAPVKKTVAVTKKTAPVGAVAKASLKDKLDSASYSFGMAMASNLKSGGLTSLNYELFNKGLKDAFGENPNPLLNQQQCQEAINKLFESLSDRREALSKQTESANKQKYAANVSAGETFLAQNKAKAGIKTTASGLQYEVITQGAGATPKATDQVTVHYKGTLLDGKQFDSSYDRGEPATFGLNQVIKGWTEGVQLMQEGSKFRFFLPYNLAYGANGTPDGSIPPFSALIFEVELIKIGGK